MTYNWRTKSIWRWKTNFAQPPTLYKILRIGRKYYIMRHWKIWWPISRGFQFPSDAFLQLRLKVMFG